MTSRTHSQARAQSAGAQPDGAGHAHVLVVDDKEIVRNFLSEVLTMAGHRVTVVNDGEAALAACGRDRPQVILTDLRMEPMGGSELLRRLQSASPSSVPIVLTGYGSVERTVELMRLGAYDVLTKPCRATEILATVEKALARHEALTAGSGPAAPAAGAPDRRRPIQEKLAMIGKLAAGVAHELNNPLDAALRCVRMSKERVQNDPETTEYLDLAHAGLLRMADIVQSLLTFSRDAAVEQAPQRLDEVVEEAITGVTLAMGTDAPAMASAFQPAVAGLHVPRGMHQVITNLLRNAADACPPPGQVQVSGRLKDGRILIQVRDAGPGIPEHVLPRVFEPFFTTKDPGKGTGLGLPISARLVEKFGGTISVECPPEGGTLVTVSLPAERYGVDPGTVTQ